MEKSSAEEAAKHLIALEEAEALAEELRVIVESDPPVPAADEEKPAAEEVAAEGNLPV